MAVVQTASASVTGTTVTATFGSAVTPGNTVCASVMAYDGKTGSFTVALTLGSSPDNWYLHRHATRSGTGGYTAYAGAWADKNTALTGQSSVTVTLSGASGGINTGIILEAYEVDSLPGATEDITGADSANSASWTSGAFTPSSSTSAADEFWWGCVSIASAPATITGPAGWTNTGRLTAGSSGSSGMSGYQVTTATGSPLYAGSMSGAGSVWAAAGAALQAGSATGAAALAGTSTLAAAPDIAAAAALAGTSTLAAAAASGPPDGFAGASAGTLAAAPSVDISAGASLAGTSALSSSGSPAPPLVVNQWKGTAAQNPVFGPSLPALASVVVPLTPASSVGGGSGVPTAGNWLFAICGWRQPASGPAATVSVGDDTHAWWRPSAPSPGSGLTRAAIWYTPNIGQVTTTPAWVYVAPGAYTAGLAVLVIEVAGLGPWDVRVGTGTGYSPGTSSLSLTLTW